jgi:hypothetical protein
MLQGVTTNSIEVGQLAWPAWYLGFQEEKRMEIIPAGTAIRNGCTTFRADRSHNKPRLVCHKQDEEFVSLFA